MKKETSGFSAVSQPVPVIYDGDMGGDDIVGIMMLLGRPDRFAVKGLTTVFGNADGAHAVRNALGLLSHFNIRSVPVYRGADRPLAGPAMFGDSAYGEDGIGGVVLRGKDMQEPRGDAVPFIIETVMNSPSPVMVFGTGPFTNIAQALRQEPAIRHNIHSVILMGGGIAPGPRPDVKGRSGNITIHSEFNIFQDPYAANVLFGSTLPIHLMTMDASQNLALDPAGRARFEAITEGDVGSMVVRMMAPAEALDRPKFGVDGSFIHDANVIVYALDPALYCSKKGVVAAEEHPGESGPLHEMRHGKINVAWHEAAATTVINGMTDPQGVFAVMENSLTRFSRRAAVLRP